MLYEIIKNKHIEAMKTRSLLLKSAYGNVLAKIMVAEKSGNYPLPLPEELVESLVAKEIKELEETRSFYMPSQDQYEDISIQIAELNQYLPQALTQDEVVALIREAAATETNKGKITGIVAKQVGNRYDKRLIKPLVEEVLQ